MNRDMDFILGILTGVALCLAYGNYLVRQRRKEEKHKIETAAKNAFSIYKELIYQGTGITLEQRLSCAIASENYEEAARLRDLIKRK